MFGVCQFVCANFGRGTCYAVRFSMGSVVVVGGLNVAASDHGKVGWMAEWRGGVCEWLGDSGATSVNRG